jgi:ArsR family transcriptional regulator
MKENPLVTDARRFFSCLGDDVRLASMLLVHKKGELCVCELVEALDENQSKISRHLAQLRNCGLMQDRRRGHWVFYVLHPVLPEWAIAILEQASIAEARSLKVMTQRLSSMQNRPERTTADA